MMSPTTAISTAAAVDERKREPPWQLFAWTATAGFIALLAYGAGANSGRASVIEMMLAGAAVCAGALLGFLFGIPKAGSDGPPPASGGSGSRTVQPNDSGTAGADVGASPGSSYRPSTNLEEVSDWLTKILIGVSLVQLKSIGEQLAELGQTVQCSLATPAVDATTHAARAVTQSCTGAPIGVAIVTQTVVVAYLIIGFVVAYLWTRLYYGGIQKAADLSVLRQLEERNQALVARLVAVRTANAELGPKSTPPPRPPRRSPSPGPPGRRVSLLSFDSDETVGPALDTMVDRVIADAGSEASDAPPPAETGAAEGGEASAVRADRETLGPEWQHEGWPSDVVAKVQEFLDSAPEWETDPTASLFPAAPRAAHGRRLTVEWNAIPSRRLVLTFSVSATGEPPLRGAVTYLLHPTFTPPLVQTPVDPDGVAELSVAADGAFTVIAIADNGQTILGFDLATLPRIPAWFRE